MSNRGFSLGNGWNAVIILSPYLSQLLLVVFLLGDQFKSSCVQLYEVFTKLLSEIVVEVLDNGFQSRYDLFGCQFRDYLGKLFKLEPQISFNKQRNFLFVYLSELYKAYQHPVR